MIPVPTPDEFRRGYQARSRRGSDETRCTGRLPGGESPFKSLEVEGEPFQLRLVASRPLARCSCQTFGKELRARLSSIPKERVLWRNT